MTRYALAVDLGGTKIEAALVDESGALLPGSRFRAPTGRESSSDQLAASATSVVEQAMATLPTGDIVVGVGIGSAGPITVAHGLVSPSISLAGETFRCASWWRASCRTCP